MKKLLITLIFVFVHSTTFASDIVKVRSETTFEPTHSNRFSFMLGLNPNLTKSSDVTNFSFAYATKREDFWWDANVSMTSGLFRELSANNASATGATGVQLEEQKNSLLTLGLGVSRESNYAQTLMPYFSNIYEVMTADLTYNVYKEDFSGKSFTGPGLLTKFSLYKKFNDYFSAGGHFNYNLAVVKRPENFSGETSSARSLTIGFVTVGFDLTFYL